MSKKQKTQTNDKNQIKILKKTISDLKKENARFIKKNDKQASKIKNLEEDLKEVNKKLKNIKSAKKLLFKESQKLINAVKKLNTVIEKNVASREKILDDAKNKPNKSKPEHCGPYTIYKCFDNGFCTGPSNFEDEKYETFDEAVRDAIGVKNSFNKCGDPCHTVQIWDSEGNEVWDWAFDGDNVTETFSPICTD